MFSLVSLQTGKVILLLDKLLSGKLTLDKLLWTSCCG